MREKKDGMCINLMMTIIVIYLELSTHRCIGAIECCLMVTRHKWKPCMHMVSPVCRYMGILLASLVDIVMLIS